MVVACGGDGSVNEIAGQLIGTKVILGVLPCGSGNGFAMHLGADVNVGHQAILHGCTVEDRCLIGMAATVLDGAVIRSGAIVGAGSLVSPGKELEGGFLWVGSPARKIRALRPEEAGFLAYSAAHYVELKNRHKASAD